MFSLKTKFNRRKSQAGFTLIEMMVAVSIFAIVAFIVVSTLLTMSYAYKKAQKMRLIMDNFNFALQAMSLGIREGVNYKMEPFCSIADNYYSCFQFSPVEGGGDNVCYDFKEGGPNTRGFIARCETCPCGDSFSRFTSPDIDVKDLRFLKTGSFSNKVKIVLSGEAGRGRELTEFFIQNTVSQRNID